MDQEFRFGLITLSTKVNGEKIKPTEEESSGMPTAISMKESGRMIRPMAMVSTFTLTVLNTKATGRTTYKMDKAWNPGKTGADMKVATRKE